MRRLFPLLLFASACADSGASLNAQAQYSPSVLDFGVVAVDQERTLRVTISNPGMEVLKIEDAALVEDLGGAFRILSINPVVMPGGTGTLTVAYRPCPQAWLGTAVNPAFSLDQCPTEPQAGTLLVSTGVGRDPLTLRGTPGLAPIAELYCPREIGPDGCPGPVDRNQPCASLSFGIIGLGLSCEAEIEVVNRGRPGGRTGDLLVQDALLRVQDPMTGEPIDGVSAGFELMTQDGLPLQPSAREPWVIPIAEGEEEGRRSFKVRYTTLREGLLVGDHNLGLGLRLLTNSPEAPALRASVYASGVLPQVTLEPFSERVNVLPPVGQSETVRMWVYNAGPGTAVVERVRLFPAHPELSVRGEVVAVQVLEGERAEFELSYARTSTTVARARLLVDMGRPLATPLALEVNPGQGTDRCVVEPLVVDFGATQGGELTAEVTVRSEGSRACTISQLDLRRPVGGATGEFVIDLPQCSQLPCDPQIVLCAADAPDCTNSEAQIPLRYRNQDDSRQDLGELHLQTSQFDAPERVVVLQSADDPCLPPTPVFTVQTLVPCAGQPVIFDASQSLAGGRAGGTASIVDYAWSLGFTQDPVEFVPPNAAITQIIVDGNELLIVNLSVTNSCGRRSTTAATETVVVASQCR